MSVGFFKSIHTTGKVLYNIIFTLTNYSEFIDLNYFKMITVVFILKLQKFN